MATGLPVLLGNVRAAKDLSRVMRSTLGPLGMEKMIVSKESGNAIVTDDGQLIIRGINIRHAAAKMMAAMAEAQGRECGDGVATSVMLAGELLLRAEQLILQGVQQAAVARGYRLALGLVEEWTAKGCRPLGLESAELEGVVRTSLAGKVPTQHLDAYASAVIEAARRVARRRDGRLAFNPADVLLDVQPDRTLDPITLLPGILVRAIGTHREMPARLHSAKIFLVQGLLDVPRPRIKAELVLKSPEQLRALEAHRSDQLRGLADEVKASGANVVVCDGWGPEQLGSPLARRGILLLQRVERKTLGQLARATGGKVVPHYLRAKEGDLGLAGRVEECRLGSARGTMFADCGASNVVTLLLGRQLPSSLVVLDRAVHNALWALKAAHEEGAVAGGGALEVWLARRLRRHAPGVAGRKQLAILAFADALEAVPRALAASMGADPLDTLIAVRSSQATRRHGRGAGIDVVHSRIASAATSGILDARGVKRALIRRAAQTAAQILSVDGALPARRSIAAMKEDSFVLTPYPQWMRTEEDVHAMAEHAVKMPLFNNMKSRVPKVKLEDLVTNR